MSCISPLAGKPAPKSVIIDVDKLVSGVLLGTCRHSASPLAPRVIAVRPLTSRSTTGTYSRLRRWPATTAKARTFTGRCSWASIPMRCRRPLARVRLRCQRRRLADQAARQFPHALQDQPGCLCSGGYERDAVIAQSTIAGSKVVLEIGRLKTDVAQQAGKLRRQHASPIVDSHRYSACESNGMKHGRINSADEIAQSTNLTRVQKIEKLSDIAYDLREMAVALEEGMTSSKTSEPYLSDVHRALAALGADPDPGSGAKQ